MQLGPAEIAVAIILAIGIGTAIMEVRTKRMASKHGVKDAEIERHTVKGASK